MHYTFNLLIYYFAINNINLITIFMLINAYINNKYIFIICVYLQKYYREFNCLIF